MERNAAAKARRRDAAKTKKTRLRILLGKLRASTSRCDCHDFAHWYGLWRCNPELAIRLRLAGHHFKHCRLARSVVLPGVATPPKSMVVEDAFAFALPSFLFQCFCLLPLPLSLPWPSCSLPLSEPLAGRAGLSLI